MTTKYDLRNGIPTKTALRRLLAPLSQALHDGTYRRRFQTGIRAHGFHIKGERLATKPGSPIAWTPHFEAHNGNEKITGPLGDVIERMHARIRAQKTGGSDAQT